MFFCPVFGWRQSYLICRNSPGNPTVRLLMKYLEVSEYKIHIGPAGQALTELLEAGAYSKAVLLVDANSEKFCLPQLGDIQLPVIRIEPGEQYKSIRTCEYIWQQMMALGMDRHSLLINLGGGVIGDMGGFCAATFFRGIPFVQIPTTLLSQVDASIGGKLGVDLNWVKNAVGVFKNPRAVLVDPEFLQTLPPSELRSGFAEVIKHALIADSELWNQLLPLQDLGTVDWAPILEASLRIKRDVVQEDPYEKG
ncbi:MAG: iron-containing alcohol dehydrogenase, partial [Bacteroidetes bacterium]